MKSFVVKDGYGIIALCLVVAVIIAFVFGPVWSVIPFGLAIFMAYFFRNPQKVHPLDDDVLLSPAYGTVMEISDIYDEEYLDAKAKKVVIFLSVFDVHVNRSPMRGEVKYQRYTCGGFRPAYKKVASFENERHAIGLENENLKILVIQVAGLLARRIVSWVTLGSQLDQGQQYGMIKFGSSTELIMPENIEILVKKGDKVKGGITVIGKVER